VQATVRNAEVLKKKIYDLGDCGGDEAKLEEAFHLLEQIESLQKRKPVSDPLLNGRWDFVFDIEADLGTGFVKDIITGNSPIKAVLDLKQPYMMISDNNEIDIMIDAKLLGIPIELVLKTKIEPDASDPKGTVFLEHFDGIELGGRSLPVPEQWQRSRPLEFSYLDATMLIARGNGGEPHYLRRD
jgi:hypothetical protein